MYGTL